jgi:hypothetical protein
MVLPCLGNRVIEYIRVSFSAVKITCCISCDSIYEVRGKAQSERVEAYFLIRGLFAVTVRRQGSSERKNLFGTEGCLMARRGCYRL